MMDWMPHSHCVFNTKWIIMFNVIGDFLIMAAYFTIPSAMALIFAKHRDMITFLRSWWLYVAFIFACGCTHLCEILGWWVPRYEIYAGVKVLTGLVSWVALCVLLSEAYSRTVPAADFVKERERQWQKERRRLLRKISKLENGE